MKLNNKLLALAKGISVWWGIYLILGCCAGFAVKTIKDLFMDAQPFRIMLFVPLMCIGSLLLAVSYYIFYQFAVQTRSNKKTKAQACEYFQVGRFFPELHKSAVRQCGRGQ